MNKKIKWILFLIVFLVTVIAVWFFAGGVSTKSADIKSDKVIFETKSMQNVMSARKDFDEKGDLNLLSQWNIEEDTEEDSIRRTNLLTGKVDELHKPDVRNWEYQPVAGVSMYSCYQNQMLCLGYYSAGQSDENGAFCVAAVDLKTKKETIWNLSKLAGDIDFFAEENGIRQIVMTSESTVVILSGNRILKLDVTEGRITDNSIVATEQFENWNISGNILSYVVCHKEHYLFEAIDLESGKKLVSLDAGNWKTGFGEYDMLYCDGSVFKIDKKYLYRYDFTKKKFQRIYSGISMSETETDSATGEKYYNYCRLYGVERDRLYVEHVISYEGECRKCEIHELRLK